MPRSGPVSHSDFRIIESRTSQALLENKHCLDLACVHSWITEFLPQCPCGPHPRLVQAKRCSEAGRDLCSSFVWAQRDGLTIKSSYNGKWENIHAGAPASRTESGTDGRWNAKRGWKPKATHHPRSPTRWNITISLCLSHGFVLVMSIYQFMIQFPID